MPIDPESLPLPITHELLFISVRHQYRTLLIYKENIFLSYSKREARKTFDLWSQLTDHQLCERAKYQAQRYLSNAKQHWPYPARENIIEQRTFNDH